MKKNIFNAVIASCIAFSFWSALRNNTVKRATFHLPITIINKPTGRTIEQEKVQITVQTKLHLLKKIDTFGMNCHIDGNEIQTKNVLVLNEKNFSLPHSVTVIAINPAVISVVNELS